MIRGSMDYSYKRNWLIRPKAGRLNMPVDVFFAGPTVYIHPHTEGHHIMSPRNPFYRFGALAVNWWQLQPFAHSCNCFSPHYRQLGIESLKMSVHDFLANIQIPYEDVRNAFFYYIEHLNEGRPFILAGHSQGSSLLQELLRQEFSGGRFAGQFIAAYLPGFSMVRDDFKRFPHLKLAQAADDLGVIITYNSSARGRKPSRVIRPGAVCVNPLNWKHDGQYAGKDLNEASVLFEYKKFSISRKHFTGARVDEETGTLLIDEDALNTLMHMRMGIFNRILMNRGSLHMLDFALYHRNLQHNAAVRIRRFLEVNGNEEALRYYADPQALCESAE